MFDSITKDHGSPVVNSRRFMGCTCGALAEIIGKTASCWECGQEFHM